MTKLKPISTLISVLIISLAVGYALAAWQEPEQIPPEGNVLAPINVGSEAQVKEGSPGTIAAGGFLGQVPGYGIYPDPGAASTIGSSLTITGSTSYLKLPQLTTTQRDALSIERGMLIYNIDQERVEYSIPPIWLPLVSDQPLGQACEAGAQCGSGHCVDGYCCDNACTGQTCQTCGLLSSNGVGYCGYVNNSSQDPRNECDSSVVCKTGNCTGVGYACSYYTGYSEDTGCTTLCKGCLSGSCVNIPNTQKDTYGANTTALHYRCNGSGSATAPTTQECAVCYFAETRTGNSNCATQGYDGCVAVCNGYSNCSSGCPYSCASTCCQDCGRRSSMCFNYVYD